MVITCTACSSQPKTIEAYLEQDASAMQEINETAQQVDMTVEVKDNLITYTYDVANLGDAIDEELAKSEELKTTITTTIDSTEGNFQQLCSQLESETGIKGVQMKVKYVYKDYVITERTFSAAAG